MKYSLPIEWKDTGDGTLPVPMEGAQAVVIGKKVYIGGGKSSDKNVLEYNEGKWQVLQPSPPVSLFAMAVVHNQLIVIGGEFKKNDITNKVWVRAEGKQRGDNWDQPYPTMNLAKVSPSAIGYKNWVVVVGGRGKSEDGIKPENRVEVLDTSTKEWFWAPPLKKDAVRPSLAAVKNILYIASGQSVACIFLPILVSDAISKKENPLISTSEWQLLPDTKFYDPSLVCFDDNLLAVGQWDIPVKTIAMYFSQTREWLEVANLPTPRRGCTCIQHPTDLMVIGGRDYKDEDIVTTEFGELENICKM